MDGFERVNHLRPLTLPAEIAIYSEGDDRKYGGRDDGTGKFVRAKRDVLRNWLCSHIEVQYGKRAERIEETDGGAVVYFEDGTSATGDVVIGADGVHSASMLLRSTPLLKNLMGTERANIRDQHDAISSVGNKTTPCASTSRPQSTA